MEFKRMTYKNLKLTAIERNQLETIINALDDDDIEILLELVAGITVQRETKRIKRCVKCEVILHKEDSPYCSACLRIVFAEGCPLWAPLSVASIKSDGCSGCLHNNPVTNKCSKAFGGGKK